MSAPSVKPDLIVLAADPSMARMLSALLKRTESLEIRTISSKLITNPYRDSGFPQGASALLRAQSKNYDHALAVCDLHGCGREQRGREELEEMIENQLAHVWGDRAAAVIIDPEMEAWVWSGSLHVAGTLRWSEALDLRTWLREEGLWLDGLKKPQDPKAAWERALRHVNIPKSGALFEELASKVSLRNCEDAAFLKFRRKLNSWFPRVG